MFNPEQLQECIEDARDPEERLALEGDEWVPHRRGELTTYRKLDPGERYVVGADVAMGVTNGDYSVAQVLDSKKRQVATWRGQVHPDYFAEVLYALGMEYNEALVIVENNSHGILTCTRLGKDMAYPAFYTEVQYDKLTDKESVRLGFTTTAKTKPLIIDQLRASMREGELEINDKTTISEMLTYVVSDDRRNGGGTMAASMTALCPRIGQLGPRGSLGTSRNARRTLHRNGVTTHGNTRLSKARR